MRTSLSLCTEVYETKYACVSGWSWVELVPMNPSSSKVSLATSSSLPLWLNYSIVVKKAIVWSTTVVVFWMCEGVVSQSHCSYSLETTSSVVTVKTKVIKVGTFGYLISLQTESLSVWLQVNLLTLKVANLHVVFVYISIQIQWNRTWKCHHMWLFHVALGRQIVGTRKALLNNLRPGF